MLTVIGLSGCNQAKSPAEDQKDLAEARADAAEKKKYFIRRS